MFINVCYQLAPMSVDNLNNVVTTTVIIEYCYVNVNKCKILTCTFVNWWAKFCTSTIWIEYYYVNVIHQTIECL